MQTVTVPFVVDQLTHSTALVVIGALLFISPKPPLHPHAAGRVLAHFREGVRYVRGRAVLWVAVLMVIFIALFGVAMVQLIEPIARHVFHVGPGRYGLMTGAYGLGAVIGGVFTVAFGDTFRRSTRSRPSSTMRSSPYGLYRRRTSTAPRIWWSNPSNSGARQG